MCVEKLDFETVGYAISDSVLCCNCYCIELKLIFKNAAYLNIRNEKFEKDVKFMNSNTIE